MSASLEGQNIPATRGTSVFPRGVLEPRPWLESIALTEARPAAVASAERSAGPPPPPAERLPSERSATGALPGRPDDRSATPPPTDRVAPATPPPLQQRGDGRKTPPPTPTLRASTSSGPQGAPGGKASVSPPPLVGNRAVSGAFRTVTGNSKTLANGAADDPLSRAPEKAEIVGKSGVTTSVRKTVPAPAIAEPTDGNDISDIMSSILASEEQEEKRRIASGQTRVTKDEWYREVFEADDWLPLQAESRVQQVARELRFIHNQVKFRTDSSVLDVGCGDGMHAIELASRGCRVTGVDLTRSLLEHGLEAANDRNVAVRFIESDMREMNFERMFDVVLCLNTTFGYFDDAENLRLLRTMARALKPGGHMILDVVNRDWAINECPLRTWWEGEDRVVLEETRFEAMTSRVETQRSILRDGDPNWEQHISMRAYAVHELPSLLHVTGMRVQSVSGDLAHPGTYLGPTNRRLIIHAVRERNA